MIKFLKNLFGKKQEKVDSKPIDIKEENEVVIKEQPEKKSEPEFIPEAPEEIYLVNQGFKFSFDNLIKERNGSSITYNLEKKTMTINKDGGTIVLMTGGKKDKIERFYKKYFI